MKKFIIALLTLIFCLSFFVSAETYSGEYEGFTWKCEDGVVTIEGNGPLPRYILHHLDCIDSDDTHHPAVEDFAAITYEKIIIGEGITNISYIDNLVAPNFRAWIDELVLPSTLNEAPAPFLDCERVVVSENNPRFASCDGALYSKDMKELIEYPRYSRNTHFTVPDGVEIIGGFSDAYFLESVTLPESVTTIKGYAFNEAKKLKSLNIPSSVTSIGEFAFTNTSLTEIAIPDGIKVLEQSAFTTKALARIYIPKSVKTIKINSISTFNLKFVYYGGSREDWDNIDIKGITTHRYNDFIDATIVYNATGIPLEIELPEQIALHETYPSGYLNEEKTTAWYVDENHILHVYGKGKVDGYPGFGSGNIYKPWTRYSRDEYSLDLAGLIVHEGITYIGPSAFNYFNYDIIELPESLKTIDGAAFEEVSGDKLIIRGVTVIGAYSFPRSRIKEIILPDNLAIMQSGCFVAASVVKELHLPITVIQLETNSIPNSVTDIYYDGNEKDWAKINIFENLNGITIHYGKPDFFVDVPKTHWAREYIETLFDKGIINGVSDTNFDPDGTLTWGQALKLLLSASGHGNLLPTKSHWASGYLDYAMFRQWIHPSENIDLNSEISRLRFCQLAAGVRMIVAQPPENPFTDTDDVMVLALYNAGVIGGTTETTFSPEKNLTRAQIAKIIYQLMKIK